LSSEITFAGKSTIMKGSGHDHSTRWNVNFAR
jgi:hypothetical protein